ncbi:MAG: cadmium-translocating P-type ATPase [Eubacterium sp.]|nr:cadmium-translocating P-type ATPase [Eubacterium sp.]
MTPKQRKTLIRIIVAFVITAGLTVTFHLVEVPWWIRVPAYLVPYVIVGHDVLYKAFRGICKGQVFDENFLMAVATIGAFCLSECLEGVAVMLFYQVGELFQSIAVGKSRKNIAALMDIRPDYANLLAEDGTTEKVDPDDVEIGSVIVVNPGEKIPIDGVVLSGQSLLDTAALTGESVPRHVAEGREVISGCIALDGQLRIKTTKEFGESTVSKILDLVENSSMKKAKAENFISKFARVYTPIVCYSALALAVLPPVARLIFGYPANWIDWITRALTFLVISCPCAVVISVPLSFFGGIGCASSRGILVKGSNYLEALADTGTIVFDKTGTLTEGVFVVTGCHPAQGWNRDHLLSVAAHAESASGHPISLSIRRAFEETGRTVEPEIVSDIHEVAGHGVTALIEGKRIAVGNERLMLKEGAAVSCDQPEGTVCYVSVDGVFAGCIHISDVIRPTSGEAMKSLSAQGIRTVMLTGDRTEVAKRVAGELGIHTVRSELLPGDKVSEVEKLLEEKEKGSCLAFVGDGINDAPVLSRADIGIAMGAMGSDAAIEAADIVLMDDDPAKISLALRISRKTLRIVRQNITFAIGVKLLCLLLGAFGIANMWIAIFADVGVMVIAVLNAVRALKIR